MSRKRDEVETFKEKYQFGTRIKLIHMNDPHPVPDGTEGTVLAVDSAGQIHMKWDNGRRLALNATIDQFEIV